MTILAKTIMAFYDQRHFSKFCGLMFSNDVTFHIMIKDGYKPQKSPSLTQIIQPLPFNKNHSSHPKKINLNSLKNPLKRKETFPNLHDLERFHKNCTCSLSTL